VLPLLIYVGLQAQLAVCETSAAFGQFDETPELTLIHGLRQRRLYSLAEIHAKRLLGSADQASPNFILLETELLKALTASAFESDSPIRRERVEAAIDQANTFSFEHAGHPNVVLVDVQRAVTELGFAELLQKEIEAGGNPSAREKMAFQYFRQCDNTLESCAKKIESLIPSRERNRKDGMMDQTALISLQNNVKYLKIKSKIGRGLLYKKTDQQNRIPILSSSKRDLEQLVPAIERIADTWWFARLDLLKCNRLIGDFKTAKAIFQQIAIIEAEPEVRLQFKAERLRLALAENDLASAAKLVSSGRQIENREHPEFDFAVLEFVVASFNQADASDKPNMQKTMEGVVRSIESNHGVYWGRRANLKLVGATSNETTNSQSVMIRIAREFYRKKQYSDSIREFEKAGDAAEKGLDRKLALELKFQSVMIHREIGEHTEVLRKSREVAKRYRDQPRSAVLHFAGIYSAAQLVRKNTLSKQEYVNVLSEHLERWPNDTTAIKTNYFLGEVLFADLNWFEAIDSYSKSFLLIDQFAKSSDKVNQLSPELQSQLRRIASRLVTCFEKLSLLSPKRKKSFNKIFLAKGLFESRLSKRDSFAIAFAAYALEIDQSLLPTAAKRFIDPPNLTDANIARFMIRIDTKLGNQSPYEDDSIASLIRSFEQDQVALLLTSLWQDFNQSDSPQRKRIAQLVGQLPQNDHLKSQYGTFFVNCLVELNQDSEAKILLSNLMEAKPKSKQLQITLAKLRSKSNALEDQKQAILTWRKIVSVSKAGSDQWLEAKLNIATLLAKSGQATRAVDLLNYIKELPPNWTGSKFAADFDKLLKQLEK